MRLSEKKQCNECDETKPLIEFSTYMDNERIILSSICIECSKNIIPIISDLEVKKYLDDNPINREVVRSRLLTEISQYRMDCEQTCGDWK